MSEGVDVPTCNAGEGWSCDRAHYARGMCATHHRQALRHGRLRPLSPYRPRGTRTGPCSVDECSRDAVRKGMCKPHHDRKLRTGSTEGLRPTRSRHACTIRDADGKKACRSCGQWLLEGLFSVRISQPDGLNSACRSCTNVRQKAWLYGLTVSQVEEMMGAAGGVCPVCRRRGERLNIDHDHTCCPGETSCGKCVRGLICHGCNVALSQVRDDVSILGRLIDYLNGALA